MITSRWPSSSAGPKSITLPTKPAVGGMPESANMNTAKATPRPGCSKPTPRERSSKSCRAALAAFERDQHPEGTERRQRVDEEIEENRGDALATVSSAPIMPTSR